MVVMLKSYIVIKQQVINCSVQGSLAPFAHAQNPLFKADVHVPGGARGLNFDMSLHLQPYLVYASSEGVCVSVHWHRLT